MRVRGTDRPLKISAESGRHTKDNPWCPSSIRTCGMGWDVLPQPTDAVSRLSSSFHQHFSPSQENLVNATPSGSLQSKMHRRETLAFCESLVVGLESFLVSTDTCKRLQNLLPAVFSDDLKTGYKAFSSSLQS